MKIGVRYFDIRCSAGDKDKTQYIKHSTVACKNEQGNLLTTDELIENGKKFLRVFPTETLIVYYAGQETLSQVHCSIIIAFTPMTYLMLSITSF